MLWWKCGFGWIYSATKHTPRHTHTQSSPQDAKRRQRTAPSDEDKHTNTQAGFPETRDINVPGAEGVGPLPLNIVDRVRQSSAVTYLDPAVRARPNLEIKGQAQVKRVVFSGSASFSGVRCRRGPVPPVFSIYG